MDDGWIRVPKKKHPSDLGFEQHPFEEADTIVSYIYIIYKRFLHSTCMKCICIFDIFKSSLSFTLFPDILQQVRAVRFQSEPSSS